MKRGRGGMMERRRERVKGKDQGNEGDRRGEINSLMALEKAHIQHSLVL